jgi:hypothetical protein
MTILILTISEGLLVMKKIALDNSQQYEKNKNTPKKYENSQ